MRYHIFIAALIMTLALSLSALGHIVGPILTYRVIDKKTIPFEKMIVEVSNAEITLVGEMHDNETHHELQLKVIQSLSAEGLPVIVGLEMFPKDSQPILDKWISGKLSEGEFSKAFEKYWNLPWTLYRDIFIYSRDNKIPLLALNIPQEISQKVRETGFASLSDKDLKQLPPGLTCTVDKEYMDYIREAFKGHDFPGKPEDEKAFVNFCEAQLLWDKSMA